MTFSSFPRLIHKQWSQASQVAQWVKNLPAVEEVQTDTSLIPRLGRSPGRGHENPPQYSRLENPMDRGSWWATVHRVAKSWTWLKWLSTQQWTWRTVCSAGCLSPALQQGPECPEDSFFFCIGSSLCISFCFSKFTFPISIWPHCPWVIWSSRGNESRRYTRMK